MLLASPLCCTSNLSSRYLHRLLPIMPWVFLMGVFSFRFESLMDFLILVSVMVFTFSFQIPVCLPCSPVGLQPLWFALPQCLGVYLMWAYVPLGAGPWSIPGVHLVAAPSTILSMLECPAIQPAVLQPFNQYGAAYSFWESAGVFFQVFFI